MDCSSWPYLESGDVDAEGDTESLWRVFEERVAGEEVTLKNTISKLHYYGENR